MCSLSLEAGWGTNLSVNLLEDALAHLPSLLRPGREQMARDPRAGGSQEPDQGTFGFADRHLPLPQYAAVWPEAVSWV